MTTTPRHRANVPVDSCSFFADEPPPCRLCSMFQGGTHRAEPTS